MKNLIIISFVYLFSLSASAFDWNKCKQGLISTQGEAWGPSLVSGVSNATYSVGQYFTSTGGCAMMGAVPENRPKAYIVRNLDKLLVVLKLRLKIAMETCKKLILKLLGLVIQCMI